MRGGLHTAYVGDPELEGLSYVGRTSEDLKANWNETHSLPRTQRFFRKDRHLTMKFGLVTLAGVASTATAFTTSFFRTTTVAHTTAASSSALCMNYKVAVVGGGPSGACAAEIFAQEKGIDTVLFERKLDNAKPCGGAIPLCMVGEFDIPESVVDRKVSVDFWKIDSSVLQRAYDKREHAFNRVDSV
jgi:hypothetical protein